MGQIVEPSAGHRAHTSAGSGKDARARWGATFDHDTASSFSISNSVCGYKPPSHHEVGQAALCKSQVALAKCARNTRDREGHLPEAAGGGWQLGHSADY